MNEKIRKIEPSSIKDVLDKTYTCDAINLAQGDMLVAPFKKAMQEAIRYISEEKNRYPPVDGLAELKRAICEKSKIENSCEIEEDNVVITIGGQEAFFATMLTLASKDVYIFDPYYSYYPTVSSLFGKVNYINLKKEGKRLIFSEEEIKSLKDTVLVTANPMNPTGKAFTRDEAKFLGDVAEDNNLLIVSDEVYENYVYDREHESLSKYAFDNVITVNSFSKRYGLTGWRVGYIKARKDIIKECAKAHELATMTVPTPFQYAIASVLNTPEEKSFLNNVRNLLEDNRNYILNSFKDRDYLEPDGGYYMLVDVEENGIEFAKKALDNGVIVVPIPDFTLQKDFENFVRICYAREKNVVEEGIEKVMEIL